MQLEKSQKSPDPQRWIAVHKECRHEAFGYAYPKDDPKFKPFIGATVYTRGNLPFEITDEMVNKVKLRCAHCKKAIRNFEDIAVAIEPFTVKSLMRFLENMAHWRASLFAEVQTHTRVLEYLHLLGATYDQWKKRQAFSEALLEDIDGFLGRLHEHCIGIGNCSEEPVKPSQIIAVKDTKGVRELQGKIVGMQRSPSGIILPKG